MQTAISSIRPAFLSSPLMGEDNGEGEQGVSSTGPLSLALSHEGRGNLANASPLLSPILRFPGSSFLLTLDFFLKK